jgi:hypothetical protein
MTRFAGQIAKVTVRRIRCGSGITAAVGQGAQGPHTVDIEEVTVEDVNHDDGNQVAAIAFFADATGPQLTASVSDSTIQNAFEGVLLQGNVVATVDGNTIGAGNAGIHATDGAEATATQNTVTGAQFGMGADSGSAATGPSSLVASGNVIVGPGPTAGPTYGVAFFAGNEGSATGNTISDFFDNAGAEGCGVFVATDAGEVGLGTNTFPDPPDNERDVCDFTAAPRANRAPDGGDDVFAGLARRMRLPDPTLGGRDTSRRGSGRGKEDRQRR